MFKKARNFRLALSVGLMVGSVLWIANATGWIPDLRQAEIDRRSQLANAIAMQVSQHVQRQRLPELDEFLKIIVDQYPEFESAGWRTQSGRLLVAAGNHDRLWEPSRKADQPRPNQMQVGINIGSTQMGWLELRMRPIAELSTGYMYLVYPGPMILGVSLGCTLTIWLLLRRSMEKQANRRSRLVGVKTAFDALSEAVFMMNRQGRIALHNKAFATFAMKTRQPLVDLSLLQWCEPGDTVPMEKLPWQATLEDGQVRRSVVVGLESEAGQQRLLRVNTVPVHGDDQLIQGVMVSLEDITQAEIQRCEMMRMMGELRSNEAKIKAKNQELLFMATCDPLTECLNRRSFYQTYERAIREGRFRPCSLIMCDIDHFKKVNDVHGHGVGDAVLKRVGAIMRQMSTMPDSVFRLGGEEFCILLPQVPAQSAIEIAEVIREAIAQQPIENLAITSSFGVMTTDQADPSPDNLMERADQALYHSKHSGRNRVTHYRQLAATGETEADHESALLVELDQLQGQLESLEALHRQPHPPERTPPSPLTADRKPL